MATVSKRRKAIVAQGSTATRPMRSTDAMKLIKETATAKFDESVDVAVNLGIDAKKSDQTVRGSVVLPAGTGKTVRVAVFAQGDKAAGRQGGRRRHRRHGRSGGAASRPARSISTW